MILPRPRAYLDWTVPTDSSGNQIGACMDESSYRQYLSWLADYLHTAEIPLPESQELLLCEYRCKGVTHAIVDLSDQLGYGIWDVQALEHAFGAGKAFAEWQAEALTAWDEMPEEAKAEWEQADFFISEEDYTRMQTEFREGQRVPATIQHADIPYRPILAALFKEIPDPKERYALLERFYRNFNECASK